MQNNMQCALEVLSAKPNVTSLDIAELIERSPALAQELRSPWEANSAVQQKSDLDRATLVYTMLQIGRSEVAFHLLRLYADERRAAGKEQEANDVDAIADFAGSEPATAMKVIGLVLAAVLGPQNFSAMFSTLHDDWLLAEQRWAEANPELVQLLLGSRPADAASDRASDISDISRSQKCLH